MSSPSHHEFPTLPRKARLALDRHLVARYLEYLNLEGARLRATDEPTPEYAGRNAVLNRIHRLVRAMSWAGPALLDSLRDHVTNDPAPHLAADFFGAPLALAILDPHTRPILPWLRRADPQAKSVVRQALATAREMQDSTT